MYPRREVFKDSPLALVAAEVKFSDTPRLRQRETLDAIVIALEDRFPILHPIDDVEITIGADGAGENRRATHGVLLRNLDMTWSITIRPHHVIVETTAYGAYEEIHEVVRMAVDALVAHGVSSVVERVGLRYIDELRVPDAIGDLRDWGPWINQALLAQATLGPEGKVCQAVQGVVTYALGHGRWLNFRYAALDRDPVVGTAFLKRPAIEAGPFFVLDFDGFATFERDGGQRLSTTMVLETLDAVHAPAGATFQNAITEKTRELLRGQNS